VARKTPLTSLSQISEINLTPLMDLTFILLITFIITFPLIEQGISVDLPRGDATDLSARRARTISLNSRDQLFLDDAPIGEDMLRRRMIELGKNDPSVSVMVRADRRIAYGSVVRILRILHEARIRNMALITRADSESSP